MPDTRFQDLDAQISFTRRSSAVHGDLRPTWRLCFIVLLLHRLGRGGVASLEKVHTINWASRTAQGRERFERLLDGHGRPSDCVVRFEPALNRALRFANQEGLIDIRALSSGGARIALTDKGRLLAQQLDEHTDIFVTELEFFDHLQGRVSEQVITDLLNWGARQ